MNSNLLLTASGLLDAPERSNEQKAKTMISKFLNAINGSFSIPLIMTASHLLGHGDSWFPLDTVTYDIRNHWSLLANKYSVSTSMHFNSSENHEVQVEVDADDQVSLDSAVHIVASKAAYLSRCHALDDWSPFEVAMAFNITKVRSKTVAALKLLSDYPGRKDTGHQPRDSIAIPQFYSEPPMLPVDSATDDEKNNYAAFALGNFFPYDRMLHLLEGDSLWQMYTYWVENKPRKDRDDLAVTMLKNLNVRSIALMESRQDLDEAIVRRSQLRANKATNDAYENHDSSDCEYEEIDGPSIDSEFGDRLYDFLGAIPSCDAHLSAADAYDRAALLVVDAARIDSGHVRSSDATRVLVPGEDFLQDLSHTMEDLSQKRDELLAPPSTSGPSSVLNIRYTASGDLQARVEWIGRDAPSAVDVDMLNAQNEMLIKGGSPPYIRMPLDENGLPQAPTEEQTIKLFKLCEEQALAFRIIANTLRREIALFVQDGATSAEVLPFLGEESSYVETPHKQLLMVLLGGAGA